MLVKLRYAHSETIRSNGYVPNSAALPVLLQAYRFAVSDKVCRWQYALELEDLRSAGVLRSELRWLLANELILHAREVANPHGSGRKFVALPRHDIPGDSCFVLADAGIAMCLKAAGLSPNEFALPLGIAAPNHNDFRLQPRAPVPQRKLPSWCAFRRELRFDEMIVKRFRTRAVNQEAILSAFQEDGWPDRIDDPLPPATDKDPRRRLSDTIKFLNRRQVNPLIRFGGDGTGKGVLWELVERATIVDSE